MLRQRLRAQIAVGQKAGGLKIKKGIVRCDGIPSCRIMSQM